MQTTLTSKGQITLPLAVREQLGFRAGDKLSVTVADADTVVLKRYKSAPISALKGILKRPARVLSIEQMNEAVTAHLSAKHCKA